MNDIVSRVKDRKSLAVIAQLFKYEKNPLEVKRNMISKNGLYEQDSDQQNGPNVVIVGWFEKGVVGELFLLDFIHILEPLCNKIFVITSEYFSYTDSPKVTVLKLRVINFFNRKNLLSRIIRFFLVQWLIIVSLIKISKDIDIVISPLGGTAGEGHFVPIIFAKLLGKKAIVLHRGEMKTHGMLLADPTRLFNVLTPSIVKILQRTTYYCADLIGVQGKNIIGIAGLDRYEAKIFISSARYINTDLFTIKNKLNNRRKLVGFVGQLSFGKGVMNFVNAIPLISKEFDDIEFLIGGNGLLFDEIENITRGNKLYANVNLVGWVSHDDRLPDVLNELKLLILPSHSEGLPGIVVEAMACGTPVLATPVGAVPDVIKDGETGFIMENNSPECIAENVIRALKHPELEMILGDARALVEREFTYKVVVEKYRKMLETIGQI